MNRERLDKLVVELTAALVPAIGSVAGPVARNLAQWVGDPEAQPVPAHDIVACVDRHTRAIDEDRLEACVEACIEIASRYADQEEP